MTKSMYLNMMRSNRCFSSAGTIACKFGGTSMATPDSWKTVKGIMDSEPSRKCLVVSAPGRRFKEDIKTTDLLINLTKTPVGDARKTLVEEINTRYMQILDSFGSSSAGYEAKFEALRPELLTSENSDFIVSRGEYLSAATVADAFDFEFLEPSELVFLKKGAIDYDKTLSSLKAKLAASTSGKKFVMPGFFGFDTVTNQIGVLPRGGSDISGALLAQAIGASTYENWTDVDGVFTADPNKIDGALKLDALSFEELRALGNNGAQVLHPATLGNPEASAASVLDFPVHLRNTFAKPLIDGTLISPTGASTTRCLGIVMGDTSVTIVGTPGPGSDKERGFVKEAAEKAVSSAKIEVPAMSAYSAWLEVSVDAAGVKAAANALHNALSDKGWFSKF
jgi:aspartate kinase